MPVPFAKRVQISHRQASRLERRCCLLPLMTRHDYGSWQHVPLVSCVSVIW